MGITESSSESESIYDTLEKVVEQQRKATVTPTLLANKSVRMCFMYIKLTFGMCILIAA